MALVPLAQHGLYFAALEIILRTAQIARDDGKAFKLGVSGKIVLAALGERAYDDVAPVVGLELGRHRLQFAAVEQIQKQRFQNIIGMVAERDAGCFEFRRHAIQHAAPQPRT